MSTNISSLIRQPIASYQRAKEAGEFPFWFISLIAIYIPFEDSLIAWLPVPSLLKSAIRFLPETIFYFLLIQLGIQRFKSNQPIRTTPIDIVVIAFFLSAAVSIIVNHASIPGSINNLRTNWRYLSVYYILVNINISQQQIAQILNKLKIVGLIQACLTSIQFFMPGSLKVALAAGGCDKAIGKGASCGTFADSALVSSFLVVVAALLFSSTYVYSASLVPKLQNSIPILGAYFALFASKKRAALLIALLIPVLTLLFLGKRRKAAIFVWVNTAIVAFLLPVFPLLSINPGVTTQEEESADLASYFFSIFSPEYWRHNAEASRGWFVIIIVRTVIATGSWFGLGPELGVVVDHIRRLLSHPADIAQLQRDLYVFDDPYWFAILAYFGIVGLIFYWLIIIRLFQTARALVKSASCDEYKILGTTASVVFLLSLLYAFIERLFRLRSFSFYFWLLAGLVVNAYFKQKQLKLEANNEESSQDT